MAEQGFKRKLTAILSADVLGYSRLMRDNEEATVRDIAAHRALISDIVQQHHGRVVDSPGDNILAEFASVVDAVNGAIKIQQEISKRNADTPEDRRMEFRIGINLGDVIEEEERIYGDGVNIAARVEGLAAGGGIAISGIVYDSIKDKLSLGYHYLGEQDVKNIPEPIRVYRLLTDPADAGKIIGEDKSKSKKSRSLTFGALGLIVVIVGIFVIWNNYFRAKIEPASVEKMAFPLPDKPSIAVLPFDNLSGDESQEYIADGLSENIISSLSQIPDLMVIARNSTFVYKGKAVRVNEVAEELGVKYVLEGSVQRSGENLRVTAQLIDAIKGHHLWSEKYDRATKDFFTVQDDITRNIVIALQVELTEGEQARIWHNTKNLEAWGYATKGIGLFAQYTKEKNAKARELFKKAVELDPNYATAWVFLAWTHFIDFRFGFSESRGDSFKRCIEITQKVTLLDDFQPTVHSLWNSIHLAQGQYDKAIVDGKKAIELGPSDATSNMLLAMTLHFAGKFEESIFYNKKAMRLNPYYGNWYTGILASSYSMAGEYEKAITEYKKYIERAKSEDSQITYVYYIHSLVGIGEIERATDMANEQLKVDPNFSLKKWQKSRFYRDRKDLDRILISARKAGLPDEPPLPLPDKPSMAVLAFDNLSGDPEQEYFSDGIAENIITALSKVGELFVIARNSSFTYKGKPVKVQQIGRELGVRYVLEGSIQKSGDRVRITAQLIDAKSGQHVWAERYDRELKDIFAVQDDITKRVVSSLQANLTVGEITRAYARGTNSLEAYLKVIKARNIHMRFTKDDNLISRDLTEEAISIDPEYGAAYVLLAATYMLEAIIGGNQSREELMGQAIGYAKKAVELGAVGGHGMLGNLYSLIGQIDKALTECKIAVDLAPNSASELTWYGAVLIKDGQYDMAVEQLEQAGRRDPMAGTWFLRYLGSAYSLKGRHDEAISTLKKAIQKAPKDYLSRLFLTRAYVFAGKPDEAQAEAAEVLRLNPNFSLKKFAKTYKGKDKDRSIDAYRQAGLK